MKFDLNKDNELCCNRIAVYKAMYSFGGFMSDVVAAVDQVPQLSMNSI